MLERLLGKITHEEHLIAVNRSRGKFGKFKQQAGLGLPIFFAGVPETVVAYLGDIRGQTLSEQLRIAEGSSEPTFQSC